MEIPLKAGNEIAKQIPEKGEVGFCHYCGVTFKNSHSCPIPECQHEWKAQQRLGHPADAESAEWVKFCVKCGQEAMPDE